MNLYFPLNLHISICIPFIQGDNTFASLGMNQCQRTCASKQDPFTHLFLSALQKSQCNTAPEAVTQFYVLKK